MKAALILISCSIILAACPITRAAGEGPKVGDKPLPLGLETILGMPDGAEARWKSLKGKVVVLEFWATWCGPCIAAIPHLNEMADHFKDKPVQFIAITDEDREVVEPFLKKKPIHAWIGLDTDKSMFKDYAVSGIPHTVVVDQAGKIAAITYPMALTEQHIDDLLAGKKLPVPEPSTRKSAGLRAGELPGNAPLGPKPLFQILIQPSEAEHSRGASSAGSFSSIGATVLGMLAQCYDVNSVRVLPSTPLPDGKFDFIVKTSSKQQDVADEWMRRAVETTFELTSRREKKELDVFILTVVNPDAKHLAPTVSTGGSSSSSGPGSMRAVNGSMRSLTWSLESLLKKPVFNETGLTNRYDWGLKWEQEDRDQADAKVLGAALREQLGLAITPAKRSVEVLIVDRAVAKEARGSE